MLELLEQIGRKPRYCIWELTLECNMRCQHCGSIAGVARKDELSLDEAFEVADQLAELGCKKLTLSGGEPTMHPHWSEIGARLTSNGVGVNMISNGWSFSGEDIEKARNAGLRDISFSLDGLEAAHDTIRRRGSFARVMAAIAQCTRSDFPVGVVTHINQLNKNDLKQMRELLAAAGVTAWQLQLGNPAGNMREHRDKVIPPEDLLWLVPLLATLCADGAWPAVFVAENIGYYGKFESIIRVPPSPPADAADGVTSCAQYIRDPDAVVPFWHGCNAGWQALGIESNGNIKACLALPSELHGGDSFVAGNLRDTNLKTLWHDPDAFSFNRVFSRAQLRSFCAVCRYGDICRAGCAWTALSHTGCRNDNPYCFYRQAVTHGRLDLLDEPPTQDEMAAVEG